MADQLTVILKMHGPDEFRAPGLTKAEAIRWLQSDVDAWARNIEVVSAVDLYGPTAASA